MDNIIVGVFITYQCIFLDYPLEAALRSALDLCDYVIVNDGGSKDGTLDLVYSLQREYGKDRIKVLNRNWVHDRGFWARERNFVLDQIPPKHYVFNLAADECIHENDIVRIRKAVFKLGDRGLRFTPIHFYGRPDYVISGTHWAKILTKLWRNDLGIRYYNVIGGCADDPLWPDKTPVHFKKVYASNINIYHYGHCRSPKALAIKNEKAHSLYRNERFYINGSFPVIKLFDYQLERYINGYNGDIATKFDGTHPKYISSWCNEHANQKLSYRKADEEIDRV